MTVFFDGLVVVVLGALVGIGELISRYRDAPSRALATPPALLYIGLNAAAALFALWTIRTFGWDFGIDAGKAGQLRWTQVFAAGFGAMALFRTSLFVVRAGDQDIGVGPVTFLNVVLGASDRAVDRLRATARSSAVAAAMSDVSFRRAHSALPAFCLALMQNLPKEDQENLARQVAALNDANMDERIKALTLGLNLMNAVGEDVLHEAVESLGQRIKAPATLDLVDKQVELAPGQTRRIHLRAVDAKGAELATDDAVFRCADAAVATVSGAGMVCAVGVGETPVVAELDGLSATLIVRVAIAPGAGLRAVAPVVPISLVPPSPAPPTLPPT